VSPSSLADRYPISNGKKFKLDDIDPAKRAATS